MSKGSRQRPTDPKKWEEGCEAYYGKNENKKDKNKNKGWFFKLARCVNND